MLPSEPGDTIAAMVADELTGCVIVSGMPAAGKSTVTALAAQLLPRAAQIKADDVNEMILSGRVGFMGQPADEALRQEERRQDDLLDLDLRGVRLTPDDVRERLDAKVERLGALMASGRRSIPRYRTALWKDGLRTTPSRTAA